MTNSSILGGDRPQPRAAGHDNRLLGPSDSSDSGSDVQGETAMATGADRPDELGGIPVAIDADSDRNGTGERGSATGDDDVAGADILPDGIVGDPTRSNDESQGDADEEGTPYPDELGIEGSADPQAERIDPDDEAALNQWAEKLDTTEQQLIDAIAAVGNLAADVEMHLKGSHSTTNADRAAEADELAPEKSS